MASEYVTFDDLVRFHKEVIAPDLDARLDARLAPIAEQLSSLDARSMRMADELMHLRSRLDTGLNWLYDEIVDTRRDMLSHFDRIYKKFDDVASEMDSSKGALLRVEDRTNDHEIRITRLETKRP